MEVEGDALREIASGSNSTWMLPNILGKFLKLSTVEITFKVDWRGQSCTARHTKSFIDREWWCATTSTSGTSAVLGRVLRCVCVFVCGERERD